MARTGVGWTGHFRAVLRNTCKPRAGSGQRPTGSWHNEPAEAPPPSPTVSLAVCMHSRAGPSSGLPASTFVSGVLVRADLGAGYCRLFQLLQQLINIEQIPPRGLRESSLCCAWKEEEMLAEGSTLG